MTLKPKSHPEDGHKKPSSPKLKAAVTKLPPIPSLMALGKLALPADPLEGLSTDERKEIEQKKRITAERDHAFYEMDHIHNTDIETAKKDLQEKHQVDLANTIDYISKNPSTFISLEPEVEYVLVQHFPRFVLPVIFDPSVSPAETEAIFKYMIEQLGARRVFLLLKSMDATMREHAKNMVVNMAKEAEEELEEKPGSRLAQVKQKSALEILSAGVIDHILEPKKDNENEKHLEEAVNTILGDNYKEFTKHLLTQYPRKDLLTLLDKSQKLLGGNIPGKFLGLMTQEMKIDIADLTAVKINREKLASILSKSNPLEAVEKVMSKYDEVRSKNKEELIADPKHKDLPIKVFPKPKIE